MQKVESNHLYSCNFLISTDFKLQILHENKIKGIVWLYFFLVSRGVVSITFDDHVFARLRSLLPRVKSILNDFIQSKTELGLEMIIKLIADQPDSAPKIPIYVWGTGEFSKFLLSTSDSLKEGRLEVLGFVDGNENFWGDEFQGHVVLDPQTLLNSDASIIVASANHYGEIVNKILKMGISRDRILPNFML